MIIEKEFTVKISMLEYKWKNLEKAAQKEGKTLDEFMQKYIQDFTDSDQTDVIRLAERTLSKAKYHEVSLENI